MLCGRLESLEYRRGIPASPRKCCGKNVMFTAANITANTT